MTTDGKRNICNLSDYASVSRLIRHYSYLLMKLTKWYGASLVPSLFSDCVLFPVGKLSILASPSRGV